MEHLRNPRVRFPAMIVGLVTLCGALALVLFLA
jgi:hypothetical protein